MDVGYLTEAERDAILEVIQRDEQIRANEEQRITYECYLVYGYSNCVSGEIDIDFTTKHGVLELYHDKEGREYIFIYTAKMLG